MSPSADQQDAAQPSSAALAMIRELDVVAALPPHPNICRFHGCVLDGTHVSGITYERLHSTLQDQVEGKVPPGEKIRVEPEAVISDVRAALAHIFDTLGLQYIDIHPGNIMWRARPAGGGEWCLIDFSECYEPGHQMRGSFGNPAWISTKARVVDDALNETSLAHLENFMRTGEAPTPDFEWAPWNQKGA